MRVGLAFARGNLNGVLRSGLADKTTSRGTVIPQVFSNPPPVHPGARVDFRLRRAFRRCAWPGRPSRSSVRGVPVQTGEAAMRVLLVEDTDDLRHLFARVLKARGFEVRAAADGHEALACLAEFVPDVVVTDLMMPRLDGVELIRRLRAMPATADVPIVAMTAATTSEAVHEVHQAGVADLLAKPLDSQTLFDRIGGLCRFSRPKPLGMPSSC